MHFIPRNLCNRLGGFAAATILLAGVGLAATTTGAKAQSASATSITPGIAQANPTIQCARYLQSAHYWEKQGNLAFEQGRSTEASSDWGLAQDYYNAFQINCQEP